MTIGWSFPLSNGGIFDGFNDAGIETYTGARYNGLAREIIQNSLDAALPDRTVTVAFEQVKIPRDEFPDADGLQAVMKKCLAISESPKEKAFFKNAAEMLGDSEIACLKISDYGTTGMRGDYRKQKGQWHAITKARWFSDKNTPTAGGSFGIGKHASFAVSDLRTVFYGTRYKESGRQIERAQGKSILMSHRPGRGYEYTSGTGFWGEVNGCAPLENRNIPEFLKAGKEGSVVFIAGFDAERNWQHRITATVVSNFFYAIDQSNLEVLIRDGSGDTITIDTETLNDRFLEIKSMGIDKEEVENSHSYYRAICDAPAEGRKDSERPHLGHCKMWVLKKEALPKKVALLRKTGMLITDEQYGLKIWSGRLDFAGVFLCDSDKGNELLREMENPKHDAFEPGRATAENRNLCQSALKDLVRWVRECVDELAKPPETEVDPIDELKKLLPDTDKPEVIPGDEGDERDLEGLPVYSAKPLKKPKPEKDAGPSEPEDDDGDEGGASEDTNEGEGGDHPGDGPGEGDGTGGTGGGGGKWRAVEIQNVRVVSNAKDANVRTVYFTPSASGKIKVFLAFAEDDGVIRKVSKIKISGADDLRDDGYAFVVKAAKGRRVTASVTLAETVSDSIAVSAHIQTAEEDNENTSQ